MVSSSTSDIINKRSSKGRQKIEIKKIKAKSSRQVTFSKRRAGLFKKAAELCVLTGAKVAILVKSPGGRVYVFGEDDLVDCYLINNVAETSQLGLPENEFSECYADVSQELEVVETGQLGFPTNEFNEYHAGVSSRELEVQNRTKMIPYSSEEELFDGMDIGQLEEYACLMEEMKKVADTKVDELKMNSNIPAMFDSEEMKKNEVIEANDSMVMKKNAVNEANDLMTNNSQPMLDSDLSLDMSWSDSDTFDMSWLDSDTFDMSWINHNPEHGDTHTNFNLNFHHGVEV